MRYRVLKLIRAVPVISVLLLAKLPISNSQTSESLPPNEIIPSSLFCLNIVNIETGTKWPTVPFNSWRNFHSAWTKLEPIRGQWQFDRLDKDVALAEKNGVESLLVLLGTPTWASARPDEKGCCGPSGSSAEARDMQDWRNYVNTVATRYKGRVHYYELWNEPNMSKHFSGSMDALLTLSREAYIVLKRIDPTVKIVSPSMAPGNGGSAYLDEYLGRGGDSYADIIGYHFYAGRRDPEVMLPMIQRVKRIMARHGVNDKPLWNTEAGWPIENNQPSPRGPGSEDELPNATAAQYVARSYVLNWAGGVQRFYWYAWGHETMGLTDVDQKTLKLPAYAFAEIQKWMVGAKLIGCRVDSKTTWTCQLTRDHGYSAWIVWNPDKSLPFNIPRDWNIKQIKFLDGALHELKGTDSITIGRSPLLMERPRS